MADPIHSSAGALKTGDARQVFSPPPFVSYSVAPDRRFLFNTIVEDASPITILLNWKEP